MENLEMAIRSRQRVLTEFDALQIIGSYDVHVPETRYEEDTGKIGDIGDEMGYPVVVKAAGKKLLHKSDIGGVELNVRNRDDLMKHAERFLGFDGVSGVIIQKQIPGFREFICGLKKDPKFGNCLMFGLGGVLTEVLNDVTFRLAPITSSDAEEMVTEIRASKILRSLRGEGQIVTSELTKILMAISKLGQEYKEIILVDLNPIKVTPEGRAIVVDALIIFDY